MDQVFPSNIEFSDAHPGLANEVDQVWIIVLGIVVRSNSSRGASITVWPAFIGVGGVVSWLWCAHDGYILESKTFNNFRDGQYLRPCLQHNKDKIKSFKKQIILKLFKQKYFRQL